MPLITQLPNLAKSFQAMKLMDRVCNAVTYAPESYLKTGILTSKAPDMQKLRKLQEMATDNAVMVEGLLGVELTNEVLKFGV